MDGNGTIDANDSATLIEMIKNGTAGNNSKYDYNDDGVVDNNDANILLDNYKTESC